MHGKERLVDSSLLPGTTRIFRDFKTLPECVEIISMRFGSVTRFKKTVFLLCFSTILHYTRRRPSTHLAVTRLIVFKTLRFFFSILYILSATLVSLDYTHAPPSHWLCRCKRKKIDLVFSHNRIVSM